MAKNLPKALKEASGKLPSDDEKTFKELVSALIDAWMIKEVPELMLVNRMVSTWMKMKRVEKMMSKYDLFFEQRDKNGNLVGVTMNQLAYYLKSLESDFRNYYKTLTMNKPMREEGIKDFHDFLNIDAKKKN